MATEDGVRNAQMIEGYDQESARHKKALQRIARLFLGWLMGFEPTTPGTTNQCSNQLSYSHRLPQRVRKDNWSFLKSS